LKESQTYTRNYSIEESFSDNASKAFPIPINPEVNSVEVLNDVFPELESARRKLIESIVYKYSRLLIDYKF
jgi:hypothetical protein